MRRALAAALVAALLLASVPGVAQASPKPCPPPPGVQLDIWYCPTTR